jgi:ABC-type phosphate transport system substrate-binding protein
MHALLLAFVATWLALAGEPAPSAEGGQPFVVIVDPENPATAVDRKFLADAFLKKTTRWAHGPRIRPVDLTSDSPVRRQFSQSVIGRSVAAVRSFWQQQVFSGRDVPPPELDSDEAVVRYVLDNAGAVGYVSAGAQLRGARAVAVK